MMQFVLIFYGKWGLLDVVKSENNGPLLVCRRDFRETQVIENVTSEYK